MSSTTVGLLLLTLAAVYASAASVQNEADRVSKKCAKEHNVDADEVAKNWKEGKLADNQDVKCFTACFMKDMGWEKDGKYIQEKFDQLSDEKWKDEDGSSEKARKVHATCIEEVEKSGTTESCDKAYELSHCVIKESDKIGLKRPDW